MKRDSNTMPADTEACFHLPQTGIIHMKDEYQWSCVRRLPPFSISGNVTICHYAITYQWVSLANFKNIFYSFNYNGVILYHHIAV